MRTCVVIVHVCAYFTWHNHIIYMFRYICTSSCRCRSIRWPSITVAACGIVRRWLDIQRPLLFMITCCVWSPEPLPHKIVIVRVSCAKFYNVFFLGIVDRERLVMDKHMDIIICTCDQIYENPVYQPWIKCFSSYTCNCESSTLTLSNLLYL